MSIDTESAETSTADVDALADELGEAIAEMPEYQAYADAKADVEADEDAQERIQEFERIREEYMAARQTNQATDEDLRTLKQAQQELHELPVMEAYLQAQGELELRLQELNERISAPLTVDFGEKAGGCCHD